MLDWKLRTHKVSRSGFLTFCMHTYAAMFTEFRLHLSAGALFPCRQKAPKWTALVVIGMVVRVIFHIARGRSTYLELAECTHTPIHP
jgi:hypothetical protein